MMKNLLLISVVLLTSLVSIRAQDKTAVDLKNEGTEALKANNFQLAMDLYEQALDKMAGEEPDGQMVFNAGYCARKLENNEKAVKFYQLSEQYNYRPDMSCFYVAYALDKLGRSEEMEKVLIAGMDKYKDSKYVTHMTKMLVDYYLVEGSKPFNEASKILASAATAAPEEYDAIRAKAREKFTEAKPWFDNAAKYAADDERVTKPLKEIETRLAAQ